MSAIDTALDYVFGTPRRVSRSLVPVDLREARFAPIDQDMPRIVRERLPDLDNPAVLAQSAADATRRHDEITIEGLRAAIERERAEGDRLSEAGEDLILAFQERAADLIDRLTLHTERMAALREQIAQCRSTLSGVQS